MFGTATCYISLSLSLSLYKHIYYKSINNLIQHSTSSVNLEEVREEWEKVKLSYEILSDRKLRLKYDRNSAVADPGAAVGRAVGGAAMNVIGWGFGSVMKVVAGGGKAEESSGGGEKRSS